MAPTILDHVQSDFTTVYYLNNMSSLQLFPHPKPGSSHCWKHFHLQKDTSGNIQKKMVTYTHKSSKANKIFLDDQRAEGIKLPIKTIQECGKSWDTTWAMVESNLKLEQFTQKFSEQ